MNCQHRTVAGHECARGFWVVDRIGLHEEGGMKKGYKTKECREMSSISIYVVTK